MTGVQTCALPIWITCGAAADPCQGVEPPSNPYLFSKSASIFGNGVVLDADVKGLIKDERNDIVGEWDEEWVEEWRGSPKSGHTTYLLMSFPSHVGQVNSP